MVHLYISDSASRVSLRDGRVVTSSESDGETSWPVETIDSVTVFGRPAMSTAFLTGMLKRGVEVHLYATDGRYRGRLTGPATTYAPRLRAQVRCSDEPAFALTIAKRVTAAKIRNQMALVAAHAPADLDTSAPLGAMHHSLDWVEKSRSISEVNGFEGNAAKAYFAVLAAIVPLDFAFSGRSTRPPRDAFNSMISLGYSMLYQNVIGAIERHGMNPFIGFLHQDSRNHATLASDLMEAWRAPIIDDTVLRLILEGTVNPGDFSVSEVNGGTYGTWAAVRAIGRAFSNRIARPAPYLNGDAHRYTFQYALDLQLQSLARAVEEVDPGLFVDVALPGAGGMV